MQCLHDVNEIYCLFWFYLVLDLRVRRACYNAHFWNKLTNILRLLIRFPFIKLVLFYFADNSSVYYDSQFNFAVFNHLMEESDIKRIAW